MIFLYKGWAFLDPPATPAVFSIILLTTRPSNVLRLRLFIDQPHTIPDSVNNPASDTLCTTKSDMHIYLPQRSSYLFQLGLGSRHFSLPQTWSQWEAYLMQDALPPWLLPHLHHRSQKSFCQA